MSSVSNFVLVGRMMSANKVSFSIQGCCTTMNSMVGCRRASCISLPPFQQVSQQGESDQIMWMRVVAFERERELDELVLVAGARRRRGRTS